MISKDYLFVWVHRIEKVSFCQLYKLFHFTKSSKKCLEASKTYIKQVSHSISLQFFNLISPSCKQLFPNFILSLENSEDPDQLAYHMPADQKPHCFTSKQ